MSTVRWRIALAAGLAGLLLLMAPIGVPAAAGRDLPVIHLYGSRNAGWGLTNTSLTSPGPLLEVSVGDNVTLNLTAVDGITHRWFIDYNNNSAADADEPASPNFGTWVHYNFTVSNRTGTFAYRSDRLAGPGDDLAKMWGNITITPAASGGLLENGIVIAGIVVLAIAIVAILVYFSRRSRSVPPPPPPEG